MEALWSQRLGALLLDTPTRLGFVPSCVHSGDGLLDVEHSALHVVELELLVLEGVGLVHVVLLDVLDVLESPGVLLGGVGLVGKVRFQCIDIISDHRRRKKPFRT